MPDYPCPRHIKGASLVPLQKYVFLGVEKTICSLLCCGVGIVGVQYK